MSKRPRGKCLNMSLTRKDMIFNKKTFSGSMSYEEERSQLDFDEVVRQNQQKYKGETKLTNEQVQKLK